MTPSSRMLRRLTLAATLRAHALSWADVAKELKTREEVCRRWAQRYHDIFWALVDEARKLMEEDGFWEGIQVLRELGRHDKMEKYIQRYLQVRGK